MSMYFISEVYPNSSPDVMAVVAMYITTSNDCTISGYVNRRQFPDYDLFCLYYT